jgi:tetratricopeptide (TPR) repeat protein
MNTKLYKQVHKLAGELMKAASKEDRETFTSLFAQLQIICDENEETDKDHPVQWETLADFTEDLEEAVAAYAKALLKAEALNSKDFMSSIAFSMAGLQLELGQVEEAIENLHKAKVSANKIEDKELKAEISDLLEELEAD